MEYVIGVYVKPGFLKVAMYDTRGHYLHFWEENHDTSGPEVIIDRIKAGVSHLVGYRRVRVEAVRGIGIALHGKVDFLTGVVKEAVELNWHLVPFRDLAEGQLGMPVTIDSRINCLALGEMWQGAGWGKRNLLLVDCGSGFEVRAVRDRKLDRDFPHYTGENMEPAGEGEPGETLWPVLDLALGNINPESVIVSALSEPEFQDFWAAVNESWQRHAGNGAPALVPAELGEDAFTVGAAALALFG